MAGFTRLGEYPARPVGFLDMWVIPIRMATVETHIDADRRLAFQVLTAFGTAQPDGGSSRVLRDEGHRKLVEFHTLIPTAAGGKRVYRTVEWVTLHEPEAIDFEGVEGPLDLLRDRFVLDDVAGCTHFRYESTFGLKGGIVGWLAGRSRVKPLLGRFMREHAHQLKATIEERARGSRLFPYRPCALDTGQTGSFVRPRCTRGASIVRAGSEVLLRHSFASS